MGNELLKSGGPYNIQKTGPDQHTFNITLPTDSEGRVARECPNTDCSPGYFKIKPGTGISEEQEFSYCPYCRYEDSSTNFTTKEQIRYGKDIVTREVTKGIQDMSAKTLGLSSSGKKRYGGGMLTLEISVKPGRTPPIRRPFEEELLRIVICPNCGLDHVIYGLAFWCPDCGTDIFLTHVKSEYNVVRTILNDVERRRESLGSRIAARDIENCLEDLVTIFEAVLKTITCKFLRINDSNETEIQTILQKQIRNAFQNPDRAKNLIIKYLGVDLFDNMPEESVEKIRSIFEKRHLITHNLGVIDKKYLKQVMAYGEEGKEIRVTKQEVHSTIDLCYTILSTLYNRVFN